MKYIRKYVDFLFKFLRKIIIFNGLVFTLMLILSFTDIPYLLYHHLGTSLIHQQTKSPAYIVLMGAGGMPGPQALLRCNYTALMAHKYPESQIIVALPSDSAEETLSDHQKTIDELFLRGVSLDRILSEKFGINTFTQASNIYHLIGNPGSGILIVTSPEHMYRSILTFRKAGFSDVNGMPAFEEAFDESLLVEPDDTSNNQPALQGQHINLRYNMWSYLQYQIIVAREYAAITYYKLMGYI
jgi:uncharacterized SAM-binding protein YcdF (DUF218 family)